MATYNTEIPALLVNRQQASALSLRVNLNKYFSCLISPFIGLRRVSGLKASTWSLVWPTHRGAMDGSTSQSHGLSTCPT